MGEASASSTWELKSGLMLVTGPHGINGVPLRRVNQAYVIATKTKVSLTGIKTDAVTDAFFAREKGDKEASEKTVSAERKRRSRRSTPRSSKRSSRCRDGEIPQGALLADEWYEAARDGLLSDRTGCF